MSRENLTHSGSFITKTLSAIVITCALAAIHTAPAAAQTATDLDCKDCIKSKHIKDGKIKGKDLKDNTVSNDKIEDDAVDSSKIEDSSVANVDLGGDSVTGDKIADGTVGTPDLAGSAVTGGKIATDAVNSAKVLNNSLTGSDLAGGSIPATDLSNEAGADFAFGEQTEPLDATAEVVRSVTITAPASGIVILFASGYFNFDSTGHDIGQCSISNNTAIATAHTIQAGDLGIESHEGTVPFGGTRGFNVSAGTTTYNLVCLASAGDLSVNDTVLTGMFFPTTY